MRHFSTKWAVLPLLIFCNLAFAQPAAIEGMSPSSVTNNLNLAEQQFESGNFPEAAALLRQELESNPRSEMALYHIAQVYYQMDDYLEAERYLEQLFTTNPHFEKAYGLYGLTLYRRGAYSQAIQAFGFAISTQPTNQLRLARAASFIAEGKPNRALPDLDHILSGDPGNPAGCLAKSAALIELGNFRHARQYLNRILDYDTENADALTNRAICNFHLGNAQGADLDFEKALAIKPDTRTLLTRAKCRAETGHFSDAINDVKSALRMTPRAPEVYFVLGEIELEMGKHSEAIESFDIALDLDYQCVDCYLLKSEAKTEIAQYQDAVNDLYIAIGMEPENQEAKNLLLWVYSKMDEARQ